LKGAGRLEVPEQIEGLKDRKTGDSVPDAFLEAKNMNGTIIFFNRNMITASPWRHAHLETLLP
jgi:hypothetical protein